VKISLIELNILLDTLKSSLQITGNRHVSGYPADFRERMLNDIVYRMSEDVVDVCENNEENC